MNTGAVNDQFQEDFRMSQSRNLKSMFTNYIDEETVFKNKDALTTNWKPENILHRDRQINDLASILAPALKEDDPSNVFIYGSVGTGKCVHPETLVLTSKGPKKIEKIFKEADPEKKVSKDGEEIIVPKNKMEAVSYSEEIEQENKQIKGVYRQKSPEQLVRIKTQSGREIECTENHSFLTLQDDSSLKFMTSLSIDDNTYVGIPSRNETESTVEGSENDYLSQLSRFIGLLIGDGGFKYYEGSGFRISITNENEGIRDEFKQLADSLFGVESKKREKKGRTNIVEFNSEQAYEYLSDLGLKKDALAGQKIVPDFVMGLALEHKACLISGLIDSDGYVSNKQSEMIYTTKSKELADQISYILLDFGITARRSIKTVDDSEYYRVKVSGADDFAKLLDNGVKPKIAHKKERLEKFSNKESNSNTKLLPNVGQKLKQARTGLGLEAKDLEPETPSTVHYYEREKARISEQKMEEYLGTLKNKEQQIQRLLEDQSFENAKELRALTSQQWKSVAEKIGCKPANLRYAVLNDGGKIEEFREEFIEEVFGEARRKLNDPQRQQVTDFLERLVKRPVRWDKVVETEVIESKCEYVYDIEVEGNHNYVCGNAGMISHNTLITKHVTSELQEVADDEEVALNVVYINCKMKKVADTEYRLLAKLCNQLGKDVPSTGLPTDEVYNRFFESLQEQQGVVIIALDEIDALVKKVGDEFLYNLTRINDDLQNTKVSIVGISNDLNFTEYMDSRVKSSLSEEEIIFSPYDAIELREILKYRTNKGFVDGALKDGVISKCSALAAQEHGDARRALDLIRVAGELAERSSSSIVAKEHVDEAQQKIERDRVVETVRSQPKHSKIVLYTILEMADDEDDEVATGDVYSEYKELCQQIDVSPLTQRRVSGLISELDMLGVINANVISKGRYGRTRQISVDLSESIRSQIETLIEDKFYI